MAARIATETQNSVIALLHRNSVVPDVNEERLDAGSVPMTTADGRERMLQRHEIVVRIIEANSRRLHLENEINGLDIERRIAERDLAADPGDAALSAQLAAIETKMTASRAESRKLETERDWLDQSLAEFDGAPSAEQQPRGRA